MSITFNRGLFELVLDRLDYNRKITKRYANAPIINTDAFNLRPNTDDAVGEVEFSSLQRPVNLSITIELQQQTVLVLNMFESGRFRARTSSASCIPGLRYGDHLTTNQFCSNKRVSTVCCFDR